MVASQVLAWFLVVLVLTQAALAGQFVYEDPELIGIHRLIAETLPIVALVLVVLAWLTRARNGNALIAWSCITVAVCVAQIGLGFAGRQSTASASLHVPLGVAMFGLTVLMATRFSSGQANSCRSAA